MVDLLWRNARRAMYIKCGFHGVTLGVFTAFAVTRSFDDNTPSNILIALDVLTGVIVAMECLQVASEGLDHFKDLWNWLDILLVSSVVTMSALFWTQASVDGLSFFVSIASILFYTKILLTLRVLDQMRNLIKMIIEVIKDIASFLIVITVYIIAFSVIFFQDRRAIGDDSIDFDNFAGDLLEMFYLVFTGGTTTDYSGVMIPFYLLVTVFFCLILLNLIISIMGNTFSRVNENYDLIELKERINMLLEVAGEADITAKIAPKCLKRRLTSMPLQENVDSQKSSLDEKFLLVAEYEENNSEVSNQELNEKIVSGNSEIKEELKTVK